MSSQPDRLPLRPGALLLSKIYQNHIRAPRLLRWVTCPFITMNKQDVYSDSVPHRQYDAESVLICLRKIRLCRQFEKSRAAPAFSPGTQQKNNYPINKIKVSTFRVGVNSSFFSRPANSHWSHFSLFHYFDTVAALWLSAAVQSDWSVRLKLSVPHCAQGAYAPLGGSHRIRSLITAAVTQHTGSNPARQISVTASLSRYIAASGPPLSSPVPSHVTGRECGVN